MPTENRSSTEMVSVPRDLAEEINSALYDHDLKGLTVRLQELLDKPELHQGDPVTLPACIAKLGMSHDWDQGYADGWKGCLEEAAKLGPLYTHPAPAVASSKTRSTSVPRSSASPRPSAFATPRPRRSNCSKREPNPSPYNSSPPAIPSDQQHEARHQEADRRVSERSLA